MVGWQNRVWFRVSGWERFGVGWVPFEELGVGRETLLSFEEILVTGQIQNWKRNQG